MSIALRRAARFAVVVGVAAASGTVAGDRGFQRAPGLCMPPAEAEESAPTGVFHGVGVVQAIDRAKSWLTIDHEDIVGLMPAMIMVYRADPSALSDGLAKGDRIAFDIEASRYTITGLEVLERAN